MSERILIMGAGASQGLYGETLTDPLVLGDRSAPKLTFYDPNPEVRLNDDLPNLAAAAATGDVSFVREVPREPHDVAVIATASGRHAEATLQVLERQPSLSLLVLEKPLAATPAELAVFQEVGRQYTELRAVSNEPYMFSKGVEALLEIIRQEEADGNSLLEVWAWSSKRRQRANPHGVLDIFGIEFPHMHVTASLMADTVLSTEHVRENIYFRDVDGTGDDTNEGNYTRFQAGDLTAHIGQGLGQFTMDQHGGMRWHADPVPRARLVGLRFAQDLYVELDIEYALDRYHPISPLPGKLGHSTIRRYQAKGNDLRHRQLTHGKEDEYEQYIPDNPRRFLADYILRCAQSPSTPPLPRVTFEDTLARSAALLALRAQAHEQYGVVTHRH